MKNSFMLTSVAVMLSFPQVYGQEESATSKSRIYVGDTYVGVGGYTLYSVDGTAESMASLAPEFYDPNKIPENSKQSIFSTTTSGSFSMALGLNFRNKNGEDRNQFQLRAGITYVSGTGSSASWYNEEIVGSDTLVTQSGGTLYAVDSVVNQTYGYDYNYDQVRLDVSAIYRTNQLSRWTAFAGVGISAGVSIKSSTNVDYFEFNSVRVRNTNYNSPVIENFENRLDNQSNEVVKNESVFGGLIYTTLGIDFRLAKSHFFWSKFHLGYEVKPGINFIQSPEIGTITNLALSNMLTLRISV